METARDMSSKGVAGIAVAPLDLYIIHMVKLSDLISCENLAEEDIAVELEKINKATRGAFETAKEQDKKEVGQRRNNMGSHYSALIAMDLPHEFDPLDTIEILTHQKSEIAFEGTYNPGMLLEDCTVAVCKFENMLFMQGQVLFGRNDDAEFRACLKEVSSPGRLFHWTVEDTSGALAFDYIEKGDIKRSWWSYIPRVDIDTGEPLQSEPPGKFSADPRNKHIDEWDVVTVAEGFGFVWDELEEAPCTIYRPKKGQKLPATTQKSWWKFW